MKAEQADQLKKAIKANAASGLYGTPERPVRDSSIKAAYWMGYFCDQRAKQYRNTNMWPAVVAGLEDAKRNKNVSQTLLMKQ